MAWVGSCVLLLLSASVVADGLSQTQDCTEIDLQFEIDPDLTREENLELMSQQFYESVNKVQHCEQNASANERSDESAEDGGGFEGMAATASTGISGTESAVSDETANMASGANVSSASGALAGSAITSNGEVVTSETMDEGIVGTGTTVTSSNGKIPDDIPPADNDSVLAAQIRAAAEIETDPEVREKLWNEYRKYKGISPK